MQIVINIRSRLTTRITGRPPVTLPINPDGDRPLRCMRGLGGARFLGTDAQNHRLQTRDFD